MTARLLGIDTVLTVVGAVLWLAAGVLAATRRPQISAARLSAALLSAAVLATAGRVAAAAALAGSGWWFVQEKVVLALPMVVAPAVVTLGLLAARAPRTGWAAFGSPAVVTALLATGYGAVAGVVVQFVTGYPAAPASATVLVAVAAGATAATWSMLTGRGRRRATAAVALPVVAVVVLGTSSWWSSRLPDRLEHAGHAAHHGAAVPVSALRGPAAGPAAVRSFTLTARRARVTLTTGPAVDGWTFDGRVPGPPLRVTQGEIVEVRLRNADIAEGVTLHWHGYDVPNGEDGVAGITQDAVAPGAEFTYRFRADEPGSYWYHSHEVSSTAVRLGLYGTLVVDPAPAAVDQTGTDLTLPVHTLAGTVLFDGSDQRETHTVPAGRPVRLRLINTDDVPHRFAIAGSPFRVLAVDGRDLHGPTEVGDRTLSLAAGARYDIGLTMPLGPVRLAAATAPDGGVLLTPDPAAPAPPVRFSGAELDLLGYGAPAPLPFDPGAPDRDHPVVLDRTLRFLDGLPLRAYTVNGEVYPHIPALPVVEGELVTLTLANRDTEPHPMHLHGHHVLVLSRDGRPATGTPLWLDTVDVGPGEVWRVALRADNPGIWLDHCHNLPHATQGMVLHVAYEGVTTPYAVGTATGNQPE